MWLNFKTGVLVSDNEIVKLGQTLVEIFCTSLKLLFYLCKLVTKLGGKLLYYVYC